MTTMSDVELCTVATHHHFRNQWEELEALFPRLSHKSQAGMQPRLDLGIRLTSGPREHSSQDFYFYGGTTGGAHE